VKEGSSKDTAEIRALTEVFWPVNGIHRFMYGLLIRMAEDDELVPKALRRTEGTG
jgi:hypothetical protein